MANIITAGNSTNGGTAITTDTSGTLNIVTGSGSGANAITIDASQNVAMTASQTIAGNLTVTGNASGVLKSGTAVSQADLMAHCKTLLASYKVPKEIRFEEIPKTSTGKIQKFQLRERAKNTS